jgi:hypothetical protein
MGTQTVVQGPAISMAMSDLSINAASPAVSLSLGGNRVESPGVEKPQQADTLDASRRDFGLRVPAIAPSLEPPRLLAASGGCPSATTSCKRFVIGDTTVTAGIYQSQSSRILFFNLHDNENTSVEAARPLVRERGGQLVDLQHGGERNVTFKLHGRQYAFDPNRIFTPAGIRLTLQDTGAHSAEAEAAVTAFTESLVRELGLDRPEMIVALHNNTDGSPLDMSSYLPGGMYAHETAAVNVNPELDPDDFFLVINRALFDKLRAAGQNVALQDTARVTDDGRLAIYRGRMGLPYVNIEAQQGHLEQQKPMLEVLDPMIR